VPTARLVSFAAIVLALAIPAVERERGALTDACVGRSNGESCERLGDKIERGALPALYPEEAGLYFALACEQGVARACLRASPWARRYPDYEALETDVGCMVRGNAFACEGVADALREDRDEGYDAPDLRAFGGTRMRRALDLYLAGCARDEAESCLGASRIYDAGYGVPASPPDARGKEARACALGLPSACERQGDHLAATDAVTPYRKACEAARGSPHACLKLARTYEVAGAEPSAVEAAYRRACGRLSLDACVWLSGRIDRLDAESPDVIEGIRRACNGGSGQACRAVERTPSSAL
jgi:TPR repeat protein